MARTGYDFQSLTQENRDWKEARAMSKEIIQFDDAMFETKLDAMVRDKVEHIVNAMPDASGRRSPTPPDTSAPANARRTVPATTNAV